METGAREPPGASLLYRVALGSSIALAAGLLVAGAVIARSARTALARVEVQGNPTGCEVFLDGEFAGVSPLLIDRISPGDHFLELRREGHAPRVIRLALVGGRTARIAPELRPLGHGTLVVESQPHGATVELDGEARGNTPVTVERLRPGTHHLVIRRARAEAVSRTVKIAAGRTEKVSVKLEDVYHKFLTEAVRTQPEDATRRADLVHYLRSQGRLEEMKEIAAEGLMMVVRGKAKSGGKYLWLMIYRETIRITEPRRSEFLASLTAGLIKKCGKDRKLEVALVKAMIRSIEYSRHRPNRDLARELVYRTAVSAADATEVVELAMNLAGESRDSRRALELLAAAARARPGDGEHVGRVVVRLLNLLKSGKLGDRSRREALAAAVKATEACLAKKPREPVMRARLWRLIGRLRVTQDRKKEALAALEKALAELTAAGEPEAGRLAAWRLERAMLLLAAGKRAAAVQLLRELASKAAASGVRVRAAQELKKLEEAKPGACLPDAPGLTRDALRVILAPGASFDARATTIGAAA